MDGKQGEQNDAVCIIPFIHRKCALLSISFRALDLEMSEFKMKVEPINPDELKEPLISGLCETTMVIILYLYIYIKIYIGPKISN
jgi:hypothetical protein